MTFLRLWPSNQQASGTRLFSPFSGRHENPCAIAEETRLAAMIRIPRPVAVFLLPFVLLVAGCGGFANGAGNSDFHVNPAIPNLDTNSQQRFAATLNTGARADVTWRATNGDTRPVPGPWG